MSDQPVTQQDPPIVEDLDEDFDDLEDEQDFDDIVRAKWSFDKAATLAEAASMLRTYADSLDQLHAEGYLLRYPIEDDYGSVYHPDPAKNRRVFRSAEQA